jgi:hypothetical protein
LETEPEVVEVDTKALESCPHCSRTFLPERLKIHLKSCKAERPLKMRAQPKQAQPKQAQGNKVQESRTSNNGFEDDENGSHVL